MTAETASQSPEDRFHWCDPEAASTTIHRLRGALGDWVSGLGLAPEFGRDVVLVAYEAAANAVEHANRDAPGPIVISAAYGPDGIELRVSDTGRWRGATPRLAGRGNGLVLMRGLSDDCAVATGPEGTIVTVRWRPETVRAAYRSVPGGR